MRKQVAQYKRVSTLEQKTDRQDTVIFGAKVYEDKCSGSISFNKRSMGAELMEDIEANKISEVHVHSIDRLGRNTLDIMQTIQYLTSKGVNVISAKEGLKTLNEDGSENMISKMIVGILGTLAEFELSRSKERQREGIEKAKNRNAYKGNGRPWGTLETKEDFLSKSKSKKVIKYLKEGNSLRRTAKLAECSLTFVQKVKSMLEPIEIDTTEYRPFLKE